MLNAMNKTNLVSNDADRLSKNSQFFVFQIDKKGKFIRGSDFTPMNLSFDKIIGQSVFDVFKGFPGLISSFKKIFDDGQNTQQIISFSDKSYYETILSAIYEKNKLIGLNCIFFDISSQKILENQNQFLKKELINAQKFENMGIIAGGTIHDLNNLVNGIKGYISLMINNLDPDSTLIEFAKKIEKNVDLVSDLANQILDYTTKESSKQNLSLKEVIQDSHSLINSFVSQKNTLVYNFEENLPTVEINQTQFRQILINLVRNANESITHDKGNISISLSKKFVSKDEMLKNFHSSTDPATYLMLEVKDNGNGIDTSNLPKIFTPFFTTKFEGRGIGLALVREIVSRHKGFIKVDSEIGKGTVFHILLPT